MSAKLEALIERHFNLMEDEHMSSMALTMVRWTKSQPNVSK